MTEIDDSIKRAIEKDTNMFKDMMNSGKTRKDINEILDMHKDQAVMEDILKAEAVIEVLIDKKIITRKEFHDKVDEIRASSKTIADFAQKLIDGV